MMTYLPPICSLSYSKNCRLKKMKSFSEFLADIDHSTNPINEGVTPAIQQVGAIRLNRMVQNLSNQIHSTTSIERKMDFISKQIALLGNLCALAVASNDPGLLSKISTMLAIK